MARWRYILLDALARVVPNRSESGLGIAVLTPGHLGDVLHAVPMLKALRKGKPAARIVWLVGPWSETLARRYAGDVDEIRVFGPSLPSFTRGRREWKQGACRQWRMAIDLRRQGVDVLIGSMDGVGRFLANVLCPGLWVGIGDRRPPRVRSEIETAVQPYEKDRYEADALCGLSQALEIEAHADRLDYGVLPEERQEAEAFLRAEGVDAGRPVAMIAPGSGWSGKNWLPERFGAVAEGLAKDYGFQIVWVGGPGEESLVPAARPEDFNWVGRTSLPLLAALMENASMFIGNDGGLLHLAAALDVPTVSLWGPTSPGKWAPRGARHRHVRRMERCEGCIYWDYREACRHDRICMRSISVENVRKAVQSLREKREGK